MNRFRKSKKEPKEKKEKVKEKEKEKEAKEDVVLPESGPATSFGAILKKSKKEPEPKPDLDLDFASALPSTDDFRTSLLMPKLSARFSMLREQDDPESLIGKASDDSVLFPRRASRLNLFGHNPTFLADIDEVSDCSRPSFNLGRGSYASGSDGYTGDDDSHSGSIMNRGRRTEGNNLFGGRQKVYKIASSGSGRNGRVVYEHDIHQTIFRPRPSDAGKDEYTNYSPHESEDALSSVSSTHRTTYSSTASGPTANARISTAATSIDEQPLATSPAKAYYSSSESVVPRSIGPMSAERGSVRTRRLYGQGLEQSAHSQQTSALHRLESLSRQRAGTPDMLPLNRNYSRSAMNLRDRLQRLAIAEPSPAASRPTSPPLSATSPTQQPIESELKPPGFGQPPLSPPVSENEEATLMAALQPEDHGKATAMGMFNKPRTAYDENQFSRRQLQMFQGRNTPPLRHQSPAPAPPQDARTRPRGFSNNSHRSRSGSAASSHYSDAHRPGSRSTAASANASPARPGYMGTFFDNSSPSETEDEGYGLPSRDDYSIHNDHPAFRSNTPSKPSTPTGDDNQSILPEVRYSDLGDLKPIAEHTESAPEPANIPEKPDSPTLPAGLGLSGLVRAHLRQDSDKSSIMSPPSPRFPLSTERDSYAESCVEQTRSDLVSRPPTTAPPPIPAWQADLISGHRREGSTETQKEREEFTIELAERRRRVQEKLRDFAESESRAASPVSGRQTPDIGPKPGNAFAILKNKSTKHNLFTRAEPRGMRGFPFGNNSSTPALVSEDPWGEDDRVPFPHMGRHGNSSSPHVGERSMRSRLTGFGRRSQDDSRDSSRSRGASPHSSFRSHRDRSSSDASGRSKSRSRRERDDLGTLEEDDTASDNSFGSRNGRRGVISVASSARPSVEVPEHPAFDRASSAASGRFRPESRSATPVHDRPFHSPAPMVPSPLIGVAPRPSPAAPPFSANATPPLHDINGNSSPIPTIPQHAQTLPQRAAGHAALQKRPIDKNLISEPTFISCTSNVPTVGLPAGASLSNGMKTPPLPPMNPRRRRQTTTQTILGAFKGDKHDSSIPLPPPNGDLPQEHSTFDDETEKRSRPRNRLRKISSEGGDLHSIRSRQTMSASASPAPSAFQPRVPLDGGMF
ncbi:hypothetical protein BJX70DRAFT_352177 [Aspergillus crustosus]